MSNGPIQKYRALVAAGEVTHDSEQEHAAEQLQLLHGRLKGYQPQRTKSMFSSFFGSRTKEPEPRGLYLFGGVGRGKSMLMDLFFEGAPVEKKRRVHFHGFMQAVHADIAAWRRMDETARRAAPNYVKTAGDDPIPPIAEQRAQEAVLLCFDEFQVSDVADAMLLGRLFENLLERGVVVVATSNRPPDDLYKDGLNRQLFLPFIAMIKERFDVLELDGGIDYRLGRFKGQPVYHTPLSKESEAALQSAWMRLTDGADKEPMELDIQGRKLMLSGGARGVAWTDFETLCMQPRGAADYLSLADAFHALLLSGVPAMGPAQRNEAKRFVTLIDALYEARVKLICSAAAPPISLYQSGDGSFEFERTASRLMEMQSTDYWALQHKMTGSP